MKINKVFHKNRLYCYYFSLNKVEDGLTFLSNEDEFIQVGIWKYDKGKMLPAHYHKEFERSSYRTCESIHVIKGKVRCNLYTKSGKFIETFDLKENEVAVQIYGTHEYEIIEDAVVIENKNGPYFGIEKDRKRINVKKN